MKTSLTEITSETLKTVRVFISTEKHSKTWMLDHHASLVESVHQEGTLGMTIESRRQLTKADQYLARLAHCWDDKTEFHKLNSAQQLKDQSYFLGFSICHLHTKPPTWDSVLEWKQEVQKEKYVHPNVIKWVEALDIPSTLSEVDKFRLVICNLILNYKFMITVSKQKFWVAINEVSKIRDLNFRNSLLSLSAKYEKVVAICGALHALRREEYNPFLKQPSPATSFQDAADQNVDELIHQLTEASIPFVILFPKRENEKESKSKTLKEKMVFLEEHFFDRSVGKIDIWRLYKYVDQIMNHLVHHYGLKQFADNVVKNKSEKLGGEQP